ncbi:alpha/beta hydrolase [Thermocatellispora tengchongensis]
MPGAPLPLPPPAHEAPPPPARPGAGGTRVLAGVPYAAIPGVRPLELDLVLPPEGGGPAPVVVFLHGGGWRTGSRHSPGPAYAGADPTPFERVAQAGIAVASADYRLSGEAVWPAQAHDVKAAVRWLRARAPELGLDPERIAAWGESAGGHLAAVLGLTPDDPALEGAVGVTGPSSAVRAVAAWYAPCDLRTVAAETGAGPMDPGSREAGLLGTPVPAAPEAAAQASPITHVSPAAPPFLLLHGRDDRAIACAQSERLRDALRDAGADVRLHVYDGADHMWHGAPDAAYDALERTIAFLRERLGA